MTADNSKTSSSAAPVTPQFLVDKLRGVFADSLRAVVLYGSAVAGERISGRSDQNVLAIVDALPLDLVRAAGFATRAWTDAGNPPPLIFTLAEWRGSVDVFAMEYADIIERHQVLWGTLPLDGVGVSRANLRLQVEHDARGKLLHLRQEVAGASSDAATQIEVLGRTFSKLMILYRGVLRLHGEKPPTDYSELVRATARRAGFNAAPMLRVVNHLRGGEQITADAAEEILGEYLSALEILVRHLDELR